MNERQDIYSTKSISSKSPTNWGLSFTNAPFSQGINPANSEKIVSNNRESSWSKIFTILNDVEFETDAKINKNFNGINDLVRCLQICVIMDTKCKMVLFKNNQQCQIYSEEIVLGETSLKIKQKLTLFIKIN